MPSHRLNPKRSGGNFGSPKASCRPVKAFRPAPKHILNPHLERLTAFCRPQDGIRAGPTSRYGKQVPPSRSRETGGKFRQLKLVGSSRATHAPGDVGRPDSSPWLIAFFLESETGKLPLYRGNIAGADKGPHSGSYDGHRRVKDIGLRAQSPIPLATRSLQGGYVSPSNHRPCRTSACEHGLNCGGAPRHGADNDCDLAYFTADVHPAEYLAPAPTIPHRSPNQESAAPERGASCRRLTGARCLAFGFAIPIGPVAPTPYGLPHSVSLRYQGAANRNVASQEFAFPTACCRAGLVPHKGRSSRVRQLNTCLEPAPRYGPILGRLLDFGQGPLTKLLPSPTRITITQAAKKSNVVFDHDESKAPSLFRRTNPVAVVFARGVHTAPDFRPETHSRRRPHVSAQLYSFFDRHRKSAPPLLANDRKNSSTSSALARTALANRATLVRYQLFTAFADLNTAPSSSLAQLMDENHANPGGPQQPLVKHVNLGQAGDISRPCLHGPTGLESRRRT